MHLGVGLLALAALTALVGSATDSLTKIVIGGVLALALDTPVRALQDRGLSRGAAAATVGKLTHRGTENRRTNSLFTAQPSGVDASPGGGKARPRGGPFVTGPRGSRPGGAVQLGWSHPAAGPNGWGRVVGGATTTTQYPWARHERIDLLGGFRGSPGRLAWFATPDPDAEPPARPGGEAGWWWAEADAVFAADPERFFRDVLAMDVAEARR